MSTVLSLCTMSFNNTLCLQRKIQPPCPSNQYLLQGSSEALVFLRNHLGRVYPEVPLQRHRWKRHLGSKKIKDIPNKFQLGDVKRKGLSISLGHSPPYFWPNHKKLYWQLLLCVGPSLSPGTSIPNVLFFKNTNVATGWEGIQIQPRIVAQQTTRIDWWLTAFRV